METKQLKPNDKKEEKKDKKETKSKEVVKIPISANASGLITGSNLEEQYRLCQYFASSGMVPKEYITHPEKVFTAMQYARELGLPPLTSLRQIAVINGTPSIFGDLPLAIVRRSKELSYIKEYLFDVDNKEMCLKNGNIDKEIVGAVCIIRRKGEDEREFVFTTNDAGVAKLTNDPVKHPVWAKYPKLMLKYRARSMAIKDVFSDCLNGMAIGEYDENTVIGEQPEFVEPELDDETKEVIRKVEDLFHQLHWNNAKQIAFSNRYGKGGLRKITKEGLKKMIEDLGVVLEGKVETDTISADAITKE